MAATDAAKAVSVSLQELAGIVQDFLQEKAGAPTAFVLVVAVDNTAQYVSNCSRKDGQELLEHQLAWWNAKRADIPAHYNPDL